MYDAQIAIWEKQLASLRRQTKISYPTEQREEILDDIKRFEQAIERRREWLKERL